MHQTGKRGEIWWIDTVLAAEKKDNIGQTSTAKKARVLNVRGRAYHRLSLDKPKVHTPCSQEECAQDCVLSLWGAWGPCTPNCAPATQHRTRQILVPPHRGGKQCPPLLQTRSCSGLHRCLQDDRPEYTWQVGPWTSCRKKNARDNCGVGIRSRLITCVNRLGRQVPDPYCRLTATEAPSDLENCLLPCDCEVSTWGEWGSCSRTCKHWDPEEQGYQVRSRYIVRDAKHGGLSCPHLKETRPCGDDVISPCPSYVWELSDWEPCTMPSGSKERCGSGTQKRQVFCTKSNDLDRKQVADSMCYAAAAAEATKKLKPPSERACHAPCPQDCALGEWENWSSCTKSCGPGSSRVRRKIILVKAVHGGRDCDMQFETKPCENVPCTWWHTGQWSPCFLNADQGSCGDGVYFRNVYCVSSLDQVVSDRRCPGSPKPVDKATCRKPCRDECTVSEWSDWGECSKSCGAMGGIQKRNRQIIENRGSAPCLEPRELEQTRVCNKVTCKMFQWQVSRWSPCVKLDNSSDCKNTSGVQTRQARCERDPGVTAEDENCEPSMRPVERQACVAPCPVHCELGTWGPWSECSRTCGEEAFRFRYRRVLQLPLHGGNPCPDLADENGMIMQKKRCRLMPDCQEYRWHTDPWSDCRVTYSDCGFGIQTRNVTCIKTDGQRTKFLRDTVCFERVPGPPPPDKQQCFLACPGDCALSQWTEFDACSQSCGPKPGIRKRTRRIVNLDPHIPAHVQCSHLTLDDLEETVSCGGGVCPHYQWEGSPWSSCVVHGHARRGRFPCGDGIQHRHVMCRRSDGVFVPDEMCGEQQAPMPNQRACMVPCPTDCKVTEWADWSSCSAICGMGIRKRERRIIAGALYGGRPCPIMVESHPCMDQACRQFEWQIGPWSECVPDFAMKCGQGHAVREVLCPAGIRAESECLRRAPRPASQTPCDVPCRRDCKMSNWSPFTPCQCDRRLDHYSTQNRTRLVLRQPRARGYGCGRTQERVRCRCHTYRRSFGDWTSCVKQDNKPCGTGMQYQPVQCRRDDGLLVAVEFCGITNSTISQACQIPCPIDCDVTDFGHWSRCSATCGPMAMKTRSREVKVKANKFGQQCPEELVQNTTCPASPCFWNSWKRSEWTACSVNQLGCGVGTQTRTVMCVRSDGMQLEHSQCLTKAQRRLLKSSKLSELDLEELDIHTTQNCGQPCPGDCIASEWSKFGPCYTNCSAPREPGYQMRTRIIIRPATIGLKCPEHLVHIRPCELEDQVCPVFQWYTTQWDQDRREVTCKGKDDLEVSVGCDERLRPSWSKHCKDPCGLDAHCVDGSCICKNGFTGDGHKCLPLHRCSRNAHCVLNNTVCDTDTHTCLCHGSKEVPSKEYMCPSTSGASSPVTEWNARLLFILLGCLCALLILALLTTLLLFRRRKRQRQPKDKPPLPQLTVINAYDTLDMAENKPSSPLQSPTKTAGLKKGGSRPSSANNHSTGVAPISRKPLTSWGEYDSLRKTSQSPSMIPRCQGKLIEFSSVDDDVFSVSDGPSARSSSPRTTYEDQDYIPMFSPEEDQQVQEIDPPPPDHTRLPSVSSQNIRPTPKMSTFKPDSLQDIVASIRKEETGSGSLTSTDSGRDSEDSLTRLHTSSSRGNMYENLPPKPPRGQGHSLPRNHGNQSQVRVLPLTRGDGSGSSPSDSGVGLQSPGGCDSLSRAKRNMHQDPQLLYCDQLVAEMQQYSA